MSERIHDDFIAIPKPVKKYIKINNKIQHLYNAQRSIFISFDKLECPKISDYKNLVDSLTKLLENKEYAEEFAQHRGIWFSEVSPIIRGLIGAVVTLVIGIYRYQCWVILQ